MPALPSHGGSSGPSTPTAQRSPRHSGTGDPHLPLAPPLLSPAGAALQRGSEGGTVAYNASLASSSSYPLGALGANHHQPTTQQHALRNSLLRQAQAQAHMTGTNSQKVRSILPSDVHQGHDWPVEPQHTYHPQVAPSQAATLQPSTSSGGGLPPLPPGASPRATAAEAAVAAATASLTLPAPKLLTVSSLGA